MCKNKGAFTLIELLVVVLIIGILSAIALPQYRRAVEKSRMAEALQIAGSLTKAVDLYVLENGYQEIELVGDMSDSGMSGLLTVDAESMLDCTQDDRDQCCSKYFCYDAYCRTTSCIIGAYRRQNGDVDSDSEYELTWEKSASTGQWTKSCTAYDAYPYSTSICSSFSAL